MTAHRLRLPDGAGRLDRDAYYTPGEVARACVCALVARGWAPRVIVEPSVGAGAWVPPIRDAWPGVEVVGIDVAPYPDGAPRLDAFHLADFLAEPPALEPGTAIVGNPPFRQAEAFVAAACAYGVPVAFLLRLGLLGGVRRARGLWREHPPTAVYVLAPRPRFRSDRGGGPAEDFALYVWDQGEPGLRWLVWRGAPDGPGTAGQVELFAGG